MKTTENIFIILFEKNGKQCKKEIEANNLEDATIYASNYTEDNDCELLLVDYKFNND